MRSPGLTILLTPKSHILTPPSTVSKILSSLMSLWRMDFVWQYWIARMIYLKTDLATSSFNWRLFLTYESRSPPDDSSMTINTCFWVWKNSYRRTMLGCLVYFKIKTSCITFLDWLSSRKWVVLIDLIATNYFAITCNAMLTFPKAPLPSTFPTL